MEKKPSNKKISPVLTKEHIELVKQEKFEKITPIINLKIWLYFMRKLAKKKISFFNTFILYTVEKIESQINLEKK